MAGVSAPTETIVAVKPDAATDESETNVTRAVLDGIWRGVGRPVPEYVPRRPLGPYT